MKVCTGQVWRRIVDRSGVAARDIVVITGSISDQNHKICSCVDGADMGIIGETFLVAFYDFIGWGRELLSRGNCPSCSNKLVPTLFDYLVICSKCGEKFRFVETEATT